MVSYPGAVAPPLLTSTHPRVTPPPKRRRKTTVTVTLPPIVYQVGMAGPRAGCSVRRGLTARSGLQLADSEILADIRLGKH